jgi:nucleotide-binding universal stress UspA family protein
MPTDLDLEAAELKLTNPPALQAQLERELSRRVRDAIGKEGNAIVVGPTWSSPGSFIAETAHRIKADLIIVGTHQRQGFHRLLNASVSRSVIHHTDTNRVCVPVTLDLDPRNAHIPQYRRVLVATDLSGCGNAAIPFALGACSIGGLLKVIHVIRHPVKQNEIEEVKNLVPIEAQGRYAETEVAVIPHNNPAIAICEEADRFGADLVCLSSHGAGLSSALHGSVAREVLKNIRRPFLIVRRPLG